MIFLNTYLYYSFTLITNRLQIYFFLNVISSIHVSYWSRKLKQHIFCIYIYTWNDFFFLFVHLKYGYVVINFGPVFLGDALRNPNDIAALLLLQFQVGVENAEMKLLQKRHHIQFHLKGKQNKTVANIFHSVYQFKRQFIYNFYRWVLQFSVSYFNNQSLIESLCEV